jgi:hypothetical protein
MIDPNEVAAALWAQSKDKPLYKSWADVPQNVKDIWRASYDSFSSALTGAGYVIIPIQPSEETIERAANALYECSDWALGDERGKYISPADFKHDARAAYAAIVEAAGKSA